MDKHFFIKTDHWALKFLAEQKVSNLLQQKWINKLIGYNYTILYRKGKENNVADALSRMHEGSQDQEAMDVGFEEDHEDMIVLKEGGMSGQGS